MSASITIKLRECLAARLAKAADTAGLHPDEVVRCATAHFVAAIEEHGGLVFPQAVVSIRSATMHPACPATAPAAEKGVEP